MLLNTVEAICGAGMATQLSSGILCVVVILLFPWKAIPHTHKHTHHPHVTYTRLTVSLLPAPGSLLPGKPLPLGGKGMFGTPGKPGGGGGAPGNPGGGGGAPGTPGGGGGATGATERGQGARKKEKHFVSYYRSQFCHPQTIAHKICTLYYVSMATGYIKARP